ncbi:hypothetical protein GGI12_004778, partial [Dipsacomyces acuminosporus]
MYFYSLYIGLCHTVVAPSLSNKQPTVPHRRKSKQIDIFATANSPYYNDAIPSTLRSRSNKSQTSRRRHDRRHVATIEEEQKLSSRLKTTDYRIGRLQIEWYEDIASVIEQFAQLNVDNDAGDIMPYRQQGPTGVFEAQPSLSAECEVGILRLYRSEQHYQDPQQALIAKKHLASEEDEQESKRPRVLGVLAVPGYMTPTDFLSFASGFRDSIEHVRVVRDSSQNHYVILLKFRTVSDADEFYAYYNGKTFSPLEPETCHVVYVSKVECEYKEIAVAADGNSDRGDDRVSAASTAMFLQPSWAGDGDANELPTCPVCLERLDSSTTGLLTILCQHTFHCRCLAKWGDGNCPVCRYSQTSPFVDQERFQNAISKLPKIHLTPKARKGTQAGTSSSARQEQQQAQQVPETLGANASPSTQHIGSSSGSGSGSGTPRTGLDEDGEASNRCSICKETNDLWICLICGTIGCGRYVNGHAKDHFSQTQHPYSMELESQCVWDYVGDGYVHRLIQNKTDGKVIEIGPPGRNRGAPGNAGGSGSAGSGYSDSNQALASGGEYSEISKPGSSGVLQYQAVGSFMDAREKLDAVTQEYEILLTSQLESQREHYEIQMARTQHQQSQWLKQYSDLDRKYGELHEKHTKLLENYALQETKHKDDIGLIDERLDEERKEWTAERKRLEASVNKWLKKSTDDAKSLIEEKALSKQLLENQDALNKQIAALKENMDDLKEQVRDLTFFISTQQAIEKENKMAEAEGGGGSTRQLEGASIVGVAEKPKAKGK